MLVCRDVDSFWTVSKLLEKKNGEIRWTEPMPHGSSSKSRQINLAHSFVWNYTNWTNAPNSRIKTGNIQAEQRWNQTRLHCFRFLRCDVMPPCQHQPTLAHLMTRLQGAHSPQPLLGGWTQRPGRLPRVLPSAEAKSSRRDFAAEVERNESGGRARCWEMKAERLPSIHQRRDAAYPPWHHANWGSPLRFCLDASTLVVCAGCQGHFHTLQVIQAGITPRGSAATWFVLRLRDPEEQLWQRRVSGCCFFLFLRWQSAAPR